MTLLVVNYHYFGDPGDYNQGIYPINQNHFSEQLDLLSKDFTFISQDDILQSIVLDRDLPEKSCLITFDDGLRCQYDLALPVLVEKGISGIFFVSSLPYLDKKALNVHKIHYILAKYETSEIVDLLDEFVSRSESKRGVGEILDEIIPRSQARYRYDDPHTGAVKFILNNPVVFDSTTKEKVVDCLFNNLVTSEESFTRDLYMDANQIVDLHQKGMLGMHTHAHLSLAQTTEECIREEILKVKQFLEELVEGDIYSLSYPYGGKIDVDHRIPPIARDLGVKLAFTMERALNNRHNLEPMFLARLDTNDVIGGKRPLFEVIDGEFVIRDGMSRKRSLYCEE